MDANPIASSSCGGVVAHDFQLVDRFLFDIPSGSGCKITLGITRDCETGYSTLGDYETTSVVSSIIGVFNENSRPYSWTVLVLETEMTILCEK